MPQTPDHQPSSDASPHRSAVSVPPTDASPRRSAGLPPPAETATPGPAVDADDEGARQAADTIRSISRLEEAN